MGIICIYVLHNPDAFISSQEMHWQVIEVPQDIVKVRNYPVFAPLNATEIAILRSEDDEYFRDSCTLNTATGEFKKFIDFGLDFVST